MDSFYITTPIYYVNANPHLGHAYTTILADAATRLHKMLGQKTLFLTGSDEHGDKIAQAAEKAHLSPKQFVDEISARFQTLWPRLGIQTNHFTHTTDLSHKKAVQAFLQKIYDAGDIYFGEFGGFYCYGCERFYTEKELENGLCPQHLSKPQYISEKNYFFRMSKYLPWLREYLENKPDLVRPERYRREALAILEAGALEDLCISRPKSRLTWGIELPFDKDYVCYVWFDALVSYISGIGWPGGEEYTEFWPGEHLVAKDILKPHAIFWPCMLKAAGLPVYRHLDVHGYWLSRDTKMSKSLGNVIDPMDMATHFGLDAFRYFLLREMRFGADASFSEEAIIARINADLANDLGNLFSRVLSMNAKYFSALAPEAGAANDDDRHIIQLCADAMANYGDLAAKMEFSLALEALWELAHALNKYVDTQAPWTLFKNGDSTRLETVLATLLAAMRKIALCLWPVMPDASETMLRQLGLPITEGQPPIRDLASETHKFEYLVPGTKLAPASNLFPRLEVKPGVGKGGKRDQGAEKPVGAKSSALKTVGIETFQALDIRAGTVIKAQKHPDADRILVLETDFGEGNTRQILSGLAEHYNPDELIGARVCAILNLEPRKIRGLESQGMILTVGDGDSLTLLRPEDTAPNGGKVG